MKKTIKNYILITVNGGTVFVRKEHPGDYLSGLFQQALNLQYWSFESLEEFYFGSVKTVIEYSVIRREELKGSHKARFTRFITHGNESLLCKKFRTRQSVLICIYNLILRFEGLGFLRGFGFGNQFGDHIMGNPEYSSIINIGNDSERRKENKKTVSQRQIIFNKRKESKKMVNVKFGDLKKAIQALNEMDHIEENIRYVGVKKDVLVDLFLKGVEDCPEEDEENLPKVVVEMNNLLIDDENGEEKKGSEEVEETETEKKDEKECPDFGKGHGKDKDKCGECKEEYPEDYDECKKLSPKKGSVKKKTGKAIVKASGPGVIGSILEFIKASNKKGITREGIEKKLADRYPDRELKAMKKTVYAQIGGIKSPTRMEKEKKVKFKVVNGFYSFVK